MPLSSEQFHILYDGAAQPVVLVREDAVAELNCRAQELFAVGTPLSAYLPQGIYSEKNLEMAQKLGYRTVFWSLAYVDWYQDNQPTDEQAFSKLLPRIHPGAVVLLHSTSQTNARILDTLLTKWEEMGYSFGTLDELFA